MMSTIEPRNAAIVTADPTMRRWLAEKIEEVGSGT